MRKTLLISIDTEADWFYKNKLSFNNIPKLITLCELMSKYDIRPTFLITYEIAKNDKCLKIINDINDNIDTEIGTHLHAWTTPPFKDYNNSEIDTDNINKLQLDLKDEELKNKLDNLHNIIRNNLNVVSKTHRAGRWGIDNRTIAWLELNNYYCDSSIVPLVNPFNTIEEHKKLGSYRSQSPNYPYFPSKTDIIKSSAIDFYNILEIPLTGIRGNVLLNQDYFKGKNTLKKLFKLLNLKNYSNISFRPSLSIDLEIFESITRSLFINGPDVINFMFHSNELETGCSPYSGTENETKLIWKRIETVLRLANEYNLESLTFRQYYEKYYAVKK